MTSGGVFTNYHFYWDSSNNTWNDVQGTDAQGASGTADPVSFSYSATPVVNGTIITGIGGAGADFIFTMSGLTDPNTPSTLKWNFSDKHDGTAEGFNVHDDQTPPCYVEKASDGTWSLTLTGDLADRQDQSPGNNWDYIETIGGTVYLNFKNWDTGGYWSGPYTRAQWSSSIGSETIRIYEHSSYSEQYNNGIYLIQESSSSTPTVVSPLPVLSQHTQAFGMEYYQTVGTKYYYKSDSHTGTGTSITYDYETKTWNDEGSQVPYHLNTTSTFASTTSLVNPAEIHGFGSQQNHNGTRYFSVSNPYYEAVIIEPQALPNINNTSWLSVYELRWWSSTETHEFYSLYEFSTEDWRDDTPSLYSIKVDKATNTWTDNGTSAPHLVTEQSNGTIAMNADGGLVYRFTKPTTASWL